MADLIAFPPGGRARDPRLGELDDLTAASMNSVAANLTSTASTLLVAAWPRHSPTRIAAMRLALDRLARAKLCLELCLSSELERKP